MKLHVLENQITLAIPHHMEHTEYLVARSTTDNMEIGEQTQAARDTRDISRFALGGQLMNPHAVPLITP